MNVQAAEAPVDFGEQLERECLAIGQSRPMPCSAVLTCTVTRALIPLPIAASLFTAAQILVRWAYEAVEHGPIGRIGVSFRVTERMLELMVEHSVPMRSDAMSQDRNGSALLRQAVALAGGHFKAREVIGGCRWVVTIPTVA